MKFKKFLSILLTAAVTFTSFSSFCGSNRANAVSSTNVITAQSSYCSITVSWSKPFVTIGNTVGYKIGYSTVKADGLNIDDDKNWTVIAVPNGDMTYTIKNLKPNTKYYCSIGAIDDIFGLTTWEIPYEVTTKEEYAAPANLKGSAAGNKLTLSWSNVSGADGYKIAYSTDKKKWVYKELGSVSSYTISGLNYGATYYFKVVSLKDGDEAGKWSGVQSAVTQSYAAPTNIRVSKSYNYLTFSWDKVSSVNGYKIAYCTDNSKWTYKTLGNVSSYKITNLLSETKYYFKIQPLIGSKVCGKWSGTYYAVTYKYLSAPTNIKAKKTCTTAAISWNKVSGASGYRIEYSLDKKNWKSKNVDNVASTKLSGLKHGSKYYIRMVCLKNGVISGKYSKTYYFTTTSLQSAVVTTKVTSNSIKVSWKNVKGAEGYKIYCNSTDGNKKITITMGKGTSWVIDELSPNTKYQLRVVPLQNNAIAAKYKTYYATTSLLSAPANITAANHSTSFDIKWKKVSGATGYKIAYSTNANGNWKYITVKNVDNCTVKNLDPTTKYYYRVAAYKGDKRISKLTATKTVTTKAKNLQYVACPLCRGNGRCRSCKGSGNCPSCGGNGMIGNYFCHTCGGSRNCRTCHGHGTCNVCDGMGKVLADLNA